MGKLPRFGEEFFTTQTRLYSLLHPTGFGPLTADSPTGFEFRHSVGLVRV